MRKNGELGKRKKGRLQRSCSRGPASDINGARKNGTVSHSHCISNLESFGKGATHANINKSDSKHEFGMRHFHPSNLPTPMNELFLYSNNFGSLRNRVQKRLFIGRLVNLCQQQCRSLLESATLILAWTNHLNCVHCLQYCISMLFIQMIILFVMFHVRTLQSILSVC